MIDKSIVDFEKLDFSQAEEAPEIPTADKTGVARGTVLEAALFSVCGLIVVGIILFIKIFF
jgi:hypothetical protein